MVLGHAHEDHRGAAPDMGVPILCHPDERRDAERECRPTTTRMRLLEAGQPRDMRS